MNITILVPAVWLTSLGLAEHLQTNMDEIVATAKEVLLHVLSSPLSDEQVQRIAYVEPATPGVNHRVSMSLPSAPSSVLLALAAAHQLTAGPAAKRLIGMAARGEVGKPDAQSPDKDVDPAHPLAVLNRLMGKDPRAPQTQLYDDLWDSLTSGRIGMVEGGTGIGKTRAMMSTAVRWVQTRQSSVGICAPTIALLRQMVQEHQRQHEVMEVPALRLVIGRHEFVSETDLLDFIGGRGAQWDTPAVRDWLKHGEGPNPEGLLDTSWQVHSLLQVAPDIPVDEVRISEICSIHDRGYLAYKQQFGKSVAGQAQTEEDAGPEILLFTHSMLAQNMRRKVILAGKDESYEAMQKFYTQALKNVKGKKRAEAEDDFESIAIMASEMGVALNAATDGKGILPPFMCLMVDEGHMLEESFSASLSEYISLKALATDLQAFKALGGKMMADGIGIVDRAINELIKRGPTVDKRDFVALSSDGDSRLASQLASIAVVCDSISNVRDASSDKFRLSLKIRRASVLLDGAVNRNRKQSFLRHSPIKYLPQVMVSNANVSTILSRLWSSLESAALVSATLYVPTNDGPSATFMSNLLQVPFDRARTYAPVNANWSTTCVSGVWVANSTTQWLYPPSNRIPGSVLKLTDQETMQKEVAWHDDLAQELRKIWSSAAGGVLVLCTSYATVNALHERLTSGQDDLAASVVRAVSKVSVRSQAQDFLRHSQQGRRPVWLAVGSAWTGVDIGGHDPWRDLFGQELAPEDDNVLTDLVIPRLPFGTNQSLSHLWRLRNSPNVPWDLYNASLLFKQALGRLVRRALLPANRRIFVLDARLGDPAQAGRLVPFVKALAKYRIQKYIES